MKFGIVVFPGSNCDVDCHYALGTTLGQDVRYVWHRDRELGGLDCVVLPGGFSYGDHLRAGAIARFSPIMAAVEKFAQDGGLVAGICNGFQILTEAHLLPGALLRNDILRFSCRWVHLRVENTATPFSCVARPGQVLRVPIAHGEGSYYADPVTLANLERNGQIVMRYCSEAGDVAPDANPNGSLDNIAGICNESRNVFGLMPHPERCCEESLGGTDGRIVFESLVHHMGLL